MEIEVNKVIPFLDVFIDNYNNILNTTTEHKSTYSGLIFNFINLESNIFKHLHNNEECFSSFHLGCFCILDYAPLQLQIKIKKGMCIDWEK